MGPLIYFFVDDNLVLMAPHKYRAIFKRIIEYLMNESEIVLEYDALNGSNTIVELSGPVGLYKETLQLLFTRLIRCIKSEGGQITLAMKLHAILNVMTFVEKWHNEDAARAFLEAQLWK